MISKDLKSYAQKYEQIKDLKKDDRVEICYDGAFKEFLFLKRTGRRLGYFNYANANHLGISDTEEIRLTLFGKRKIRRIKLTDMISITKI